MGWKIYCVGPEIQRPSQIAVGEDERRGECRDRYDTDATEGYTKTCMTARIYI